MAVAAPVPVSNHAVIIINRDFRHSFHILRVVFFKPVRCLTFEIPSAIDDTVHGLSNLINVAFTYFPQIQIIHHVYLSPTNLYFKVTSHPMFSLNSQSP